MKHQHPCHVKCPDSTQACPSLHRCRHRLEAAIVAGREAWFPAPSHLAHHPVTCLGSQLHHLRRLEMSVQACTCTATPLLARGASPITEYHLLVHGRQEATLALRTGEVVRQRYLPYHQVDLILPPVLFRHTLPLAGERASTSLILRWRRTIL